MPEFNNDDWEDFNSHDWEETPAWLWDQATDGQGWNDDYGRMLFDMVFVDPVDTTTRESVFDALKDWFMDEYGVGFEDVFDWDAWREWYE
jgi:hypothetical protein